MVTKQQVLCLESSMTAVETMELEHRVMPKTKQCQAGSVPAISCQHYLTPPQGIRMDKIKHVVANTVKRYV